jgi:epoxyqueuosine reductase QueG
MLEKVSSCITETVRAYEAAHGLAGSWRTPLVSVISADDSDSALSWTLLKEAVSPAHLLPEDILPGAKSVISFFVPFEARIVNSNTTPGPASETWALAYIQTNDLIAHISADLEALLRSNGAKSGKIPATHNFDEERLISDWSHRHVAYLAGLGSFGLNNMLITRAGCCGRFGSLVTDLAFPAGEYTPKIPPAERCLSKLGKKCGLCRKRCPAGAYEGGRFDRHRCYAQCLENARLHRRLGLADVCGKCLTGLPCSLRDPSGSTF